MVFARAAERKKPGRKLAIEPDSQLSVPAFGRWGLMDPGYPRLERFVALLSDRDADHAAQPMRARATAPSRATLPTAASSLERNNRRPFC
jgi:hypothetical protein